MDKRNLQDPEDKLYWDNIQLNGKIGKAKFSYNAGQMFQAAALLYKLTKNKRYPDAQQLAEACFGYFSKRRRNWIFQN
jgi:NifU-like protein involved in Fe-S cluster formation